MAAFARADMERKTFNSATGDQIHGAIEVEGKGDVVLNKGGEESAVTAKGFGLTLIDIKASKRPHSGIRPADVLCLGRQQHS